MIKRLLFALCVLCLVPPALAQGDGEEPGGPPPALQAAHNQVVRFLELSEEQVTAFDEIYLIHREAEVPLHEAIAALQEELETLLAGESPDPAAVGSLVIQRRDLGAELAEVHRVYHDEVLLILDEEQADRLLFLARAERVQEIISAFKLFELIRRR